MKPTERGVIGVADLTRRLRLSVERSTGSDWVQGEVGALRRAASGHVYFTLKDEREDAAMSCVLYRMQAQRARRLAEGARVQLLGRATVWAPRGQLQFIVDALRPAGRGALLEALERLKEKLKEEGLFDPERKRPLPSDPKIIGVVTSAHGAVWHDIQVVSLRRAPLRLVLAPALVQGEGAPHSLIRGLDLLERYPGLDAIILGRGGGSLEDLMAFNDEALVRRVARAKVPVVSAVGHEVDTTLCDLVADARAATPSEAAERLVPERRSRLQHFEALAHRLARVTRSRLNEERGTLELLRSKVFDPRFVIAEKQQRVDELMLSMERAMRKRCVLERQRMAALEQRVLRRHPRRVVSSARARLVPLETRMTRNVRAMLYHHALQLQKTCTQLEGLSPLSVLGRGYAIVLDDAGRALRRSDETNVGKALVVRLAKGELSARVTEVR